MIKILIKIKSFKKKCEDQNKDLIKKKYRFRASDMAGPAAAKERGTGYGVALMLALLEVDGFSA